MNSEIVPSFVINHLKELQALTGDAAGAQRPAWTPTWDRARGWLREKLSALPVAVETDPAGNTWATLPGASPRALVMGSHIDSVPNGGWLDGALGVAAGLEVLRRFATGGVPPVTVRLVAWADEEGSQFGRSLFTSGVFEPGFDPAALFDETDRNGNRLPDVVARWGVDLKRMGEAARQIDQAGAYLELHIEQGPVLESLNLPLAAVTGTLGVERYAIRFSGQTAHAGSTPMAMRRDALLAAARLALEVRQVAGQFGGVCTVGSVITRPGIVTAVAGQCDCTLDQRHQDPEALAGMLAAAQAACQRIAAEERVSAEWTPLFRIQPVHFTPALVDLCAEAVEETNGAGWKMPSGPLHDAVSMVRAGVPTAMMFVQSLGGLSHTREEDTREEHLLLAVRAFDRLADKVAAWMQK